VEDAAMMILLVLQLAVPGLLVLWLAIAPPSSRAGQVLHVVATGAWLVAIALVGLWTVLPWWTPHALAVALLAAAARRFRRIQLSPAMPAGWRAWAGAALYLSIVRIGKWGFRAHGMRPVDPAEYAGFGSPVLAPCDGAVVQAVDGVPDNVVPQTNPEQMPGKHVILR
jgi:hypothetical protein